MIMVRQAGNAKGHVGLWEEGRRPGTVTATACTRSLWPVNGRPSGGPVGRSHSRQGMLHNFPRGRSLMLSPWPAVGCRGAHAVRCAAAAGRVVFVQSVEVGEWWIC